MAEGEGKAVKKTQSMVHLPAISYDRYGDVYYRTDGDASHRYGVHRSSSVPEFAGPATWKVKSSPYRLHYADNDLYSDYVWERRYYSRPLYYPYSAWPNRRYYGLDPPWHHWWAYPSLGYMSRYGRYGEFDNLNPTYWRRFRDPYYERPLWYPYRPWFYESIANQRASDMCRRGLINFETYNKYWLAPFYWERQHYYDFGPYTPPSWSRSPRRYYHYYNVL